jgi:Cu2+-exporting ATPase
MYLVAKTEDHSQSSLVNLFGEQPRFVHSLVDGVEVQIPFEQVQSGSIVVVQAGEMIPVDGRVLQGTAAVDQHMLTGEAQPLEKTAGDPVFNATVVLAGQLQVETTQTGPQTVAAQIGQILNQTSDFKTTLQSRAMVFIDQVSLPVLVVSAVTWATVGLDQALGVMFVYPGYRMLYLNPLSMLGHLHLASQKGILIKDGRSLELLDQVDTLVFDKTGTLTLEQPQLSQIHACQGFTPREVLQFAAIAERKQSHPLAQAILQAAQEQALELPPVDEASYQLGFGIKVKLNGQTIRVGSQRFLAQEGLTLPPEIEAAQTRCHQVGHTLVLVACDDKLMGGLELQVTIRPEAQTVIQQLKARGFKLVIISGDHPEPTRHLAASLGIDDYYAQVLPEAKVNLVTQLETQGQKVCFVGDGINDALALKKATCSVSLRGATTIATDTAQIVLMDANLSQLPHLFELAESYNKNIKVNFIISVAPSAVYIAGAYLFGWPMLTAMLIQQSTTLFALYNVIQPLLKEEEHKALP